MHSMLFVASQPTDSNVNSQAWNDWRAFANRATSRLGKLQGAERLGENVWMVNMRTDPLPLGLLVAGADDLGIAYRLLPFADEPQWLPDASGSRHP